MRAVYGSAGMQFHEDELENTVDGEEQMHLSPGGARLAGVDVHVTDGRGGKTLALNLFAEDRLTLAQAARLSGLEEELENDVAVLHERGINLP